MSEQRRWGRNEPAGPGRRRLFWKVPPDPVTGKRRRPSKTIEGTYEDGELELARIRIALEGTSGDETWIEFWAGVVEPTLPDLASKTRSGYERVWNRELKPRIGSDLVSATSYQRVCRVIGDIEAPSVQRAAKALWKKMCNMAIRQEPPLLTWNPVDRSIPLKRENKREKTTLYAGEVGCYVGKLAGSRYRPLVVMEAVGGMRHEEASAVVGRTDISEVRIRDSRYAVVHVARAIVSVDGIKELKGTKTLGSERDVWFAEPWAGEVLSLREKGPVMPSPYLPHEDMDESWFANPQHVSRNWRKWCERNKVRYVRFGDMRTVYSDLHGEAESPDGSVSLAMGHSDGTTRGSNYRTRRQKVLALLADNMAEYLAEEAPCSVKIAELEQEPDTFWNELFGKTAGQNS